MWGGDCLLPAANQCYQFIGYRFSGTLDYNSKNVKTNPTVTRYAGTEDVWRFCKGQLIMNLFQCERYKKNHDHLFQFSFNASNVVDDDGFKFKDDNYWSDSSVDQYDLPPSRDFWFLSRGRLPIATISTNSSHHHDDDDDDAHQAKSENLAGKHCLLTSYYRNSFYFEGAHQRWPFHPSFESSPI